MGVSQRDKLGRIQKLDLDELEIIRLYVEDKLGSPTIALRFNCSKPTIICILRKNNIEIRKQGVVFDTKDTLEIIKLYVKDKRSSPKIAKKFNCTSHIVLNILKRNNITLHPRGTFCDTRAILELNKKRKGKTWEEVFGKEMADRYRKKLSKAQSGANGVHFGKNLSKEHRRKISNAMKGKIPKNLSFINKNKSGEGNPMYGKFRELSGNWNGGTSYEPYDTRFTNRFKNKIRKRDNQICMLCLIHRERLKIALAVHHIDYDKLLSIPQNCVSLCNSCHSRTNSNRPHWTKFFQSLLAEKYRYNYSEEGEIILQIEN